MSSDHTQLINARHERLMGAHHAHHCLVAGSLIGSPTVLLLHGFPDTPHAWVPMMGALAKSGCRAIAPFMRGYWAEHPQHDRVSITLLADDIDDLITALDATEVIIIGHDWGAIAAYLFAARSPAKLKRLITIGTPHPHAMPLSPLALWSVRHFISFQLPDAADTVAKDQFALIDTLYRRWSPTWDLSAEETRPVKEIFAHRPSLITALGYYRGFNPLHLAPLGASKIHSPTLAIAGRDDPSMSPALFERARSCFAHDYEVCVLPGGHFVHRESSAAAIDAALNFIHKPIPLV